MLPQPCAPLKRCFLTKNTRARVEDIGKVPTSDTSLGRNTGYSTYNLHFKEMYIITCIFVNSQKFKNLFYLNYFLRAELVAGLNAGAQQNISTRTTTFTAHLFRLNFKIDQ